MSQSARERLATVASVLFVAFTMTVIFGPLLLLAVFSFNDSTVISLPFEGFTTQWYSDAFSDPGARTAVLHSLLVASIVTPVCLVLGTASAVGLTRVRFRGRGAVAALHGAPLVVPWLIIGVAGLILFSQVGIPLSLTTVTAMHIVCTFPLVVAIVSAGLVRFERSVEEAAIDLGATQGQMVRWVMLPQLGPSLAAAGIFAFSWSFNNFEISFFTGGYEQTFPVWVFSVLRHASNLPVVNAMSTVISVAQVALVMGAWFAMKRIARKRGEEGQLGDLLTGAVR